jgi:hypothetical protein
MEIYLILNEIIGENILLCKQNHSFLNNLLRIVKKDDYQRTKQKKNFFFFFFFVQPQI